jgi:nitrate reductase gamma subunit
MYLGMTARLALGLLTWLMTWLAPAATLTETLADKNAPTVALIYEVLGLLVVVGAVMAVVRRYVVKDDQLITGTQDTLAVILLGAIFLLGFVVEGMRILATDLRPGLAVFSFVGYTISLTLGWLPVDWGAVYPWLWYFHAGLVALFVAYLPFSKFLHVLVGPVVAALNAALETEVP